MTTVMLWIGTGGEDIKLTEEQKELTFESIRFNDSWPIFPQTQTKEFFKEKFIELACQLNVHRDELRFGGILNSMAQVLYTYLLGNKLHVVICSAKVRDEVYNVNGTGVSPYGIFGGYGSHGESLCNPEKCLSELTFASKDLKDMSLSVNIGLSSITFLPTSFWSDPFLEISGREPGSERGDPNFFLN